MQKPNLILLHGAVGCSQSFENLKSLLSKDFKLIVPDLKWHGSRSFSDSAFTMEDLVEDFEDILEKEDIKPANVFGFSMGGYVALSLALKRPEYFKKIMTLGTKLDWEPKQAEEESKMLNPEKIEKKVPQFAQHLKSLHGENWGQLLRQTAAMMQGLGASPILTTENISTIDLPIKLCLGDQDHMVTLEETDAFCSALLHGEMKLLPNCPHPIEKVDSNSLAKNIVEFFT